METSSSPSRRRDRLHVVQYGPWHYRNDAVLVAEFDGHGDPANVPLVSLKIWVQIHDLLISIKTEEMGWTLGAKLRTIVVMSHKNKKIIDKHLRVRVEQMADEPLRKYIDTTHVGSTNKILFDVKYENLPNFCLDGDIVHVTEEMGRGLEELQDTRREFVIEEKEEGGAPKEATDPGVVGQLTGASNNAH
ncbi:hypothetical protein D1007_50498 [Hordeum vulgare]|nr:hypothetical protein D1007_50498 [Hordeum vulgare]